ncbi:MAG: NusB antitermination factor, utilization substance protein [Candidatus Taylorbacteria bacterium]|nr:NusB antitermination factor, utilization substance protein [Candidatus Taylorbacteria bacterium]
MANRHLSRSVVMQTLFEWDFHDKKITDLAPSLERNAEEFATGVADEPFMRKLTEGILKKYPDLDKIISKAAPDWPLEKIATIDRNILRIGLFELLFGDKLEVPPKVAINEAIELAKTYGGENSGKFINGVLGAVYKELGEPGKDQQTKLKKYEEIPYEKMDLEQLGGAVVYARHEGDIYLAFVHDVFGRWTLSKGRLEEGESLEEGTVREIKEEMGVDITIKEKLGDNEYIANRPERGKYRKHVMYFLAESKYQDLKLGNSGGLDDCRWFKVNQILDLNFYDDILPIVTKAIKLLAQGK